MAIIPPAFAPPGRADGALALGRFPRPLGPLIERHPNLAVICLGQQQKGSSRRSPLRRDQGALTPRATPRATPLCAKRPSLFLPNNSPQPSLRA